MLKKPTASDKEQKMKEGDWGIEITKVSNGFLVKDSDGQLTVIEEKEGDEIAATVELLWLLIDSFDLGGDRYSRERVRVIREVGDKYGLKNSERIIEISYRQLARERQK